MNCVIEVTDTFGGEANYSWVRRHTVTIPEGSTHRQVMLLCKKAADLTGVRATQVYNLGDQMRYDIAGACICFFITWEV